MRLTTLVSVASILLCLCSLQAQEKGKDKKKVFDPKKLPDTKIPCDMSSLEKYFTIVEGGFDKNEELIWWLIEAKKDLDYLGVLSPYILPLRFRFLNADGVNMKTTFKELYVTNDKEGLSNSKGGSFGDRYVSGFKKGERVYVFVKFVDQKMLDKTNKAELKKRD